MIIWIYKQYFKITHTRIKSLRLALFLTFQSSLLSSLSIQLVPTRPSTNYVYFTNLTLPWSICFLLLLRNHYCILQIGKDRRSFSVTIDTIAIICPFCLHNRLSESLLSVVSNMPASIYSHMCVSLNFFVSYNYTLRIHYITYDIYQKIQQKNPTIICFRLEKLTSYEINAIVKVWWDDSYDVIDVLAENRITKILLLRLL